MMFFEDVKEILEISRKVGTGIFVVPSTVSVEIPGALILEPEDKATITIEQVRDVLGKLTTRQISDQFVLIRPADKLGEEAENALLKSLEEPAERVHFVLTTDELSKLLPTVRSRAAVYILRTPFKLDGGILAEEKVKVLAKRLLAAKPADLVQIADEITKKKDGVRAHALAVVGAAIEMAYRSYFLTGKAAFLMRTTKLISLYEAISKNGNTKLQIVAQML